MSQKIFLNDVFLFSLEDIPKTDILSHHRLNDHVKRNEIVPKRK